MEGVATITETIFENRFQHVAELVRMGARIRLEGRWAVVEGPARLTGRPRHGERPARLGRARASPA